MIRCPHCGGQVPEPHRAEPRPLTVQQRRVYEYVYRYNVQHGVAPALGEIAQAIGVTSPATVHGHLKTLERKGWLAREHNGVRATSCLVPIDG